jgi:CheY-like chemotaxis protein
MPKILIVDDADDVRYLLARLLRLGGYLTASAEDGLAGLAEIERARPDLIVLDLMMPRMNGVDMLAVLREDVRFGRIPVLVYTAVSSGKMIDECERLGIEGRIVKGSTESTSILERIEKILQEQPPAVQPAEGRWPGDVPPLHR